MHPFVGIRHSCGRCHLQQDSDAGSSSSKSNKRRRTSAAANNANGSNNADESSRRAQNRLSQRESRQRKALHTQQLEGEVALYKLNTDERLRSLLYTIHLFIEENAKIRQMLAQMADFVGEFGGGLLASRGANIADIKAASQINDREWIFGKAEEIRAGALEKAGASNEDKPSAVPAASTSIPPANYADATGSTADMLPVPDVRVLTGEASAFVSAGLSASQAPSPDLLSQFLNSSAMHASLVGPVPSFEASASPSGSSDPLTNYMPSPWPAYQAVPPAIASSPASNTLASQANQLVN